MQARRPSAVPALAIVLPRPSLPQRRSSKLSNSTSPHTPSRGSPTYSSLFLPSGSNRKSTDSWNSSNYDGPDDEFEWKPEQTLLLSRTLDALPSHLLTPFNGAVPPSNLLDKIARGVSQAKGSEDWPHSLRATRVKLVELARLHAKETAQHTQRKAIPEEEDDNHFECSDRGNNEVLQQTTNSPPKRPLYRQSSMDFLKPNKVDLKNNDNISRLSNRLQRTDRIIPNPAFHPYLRPNARSRSPPPSRRDSSPPSRTLDLSTPSSSTLNSSRSSSICLRPRPLRRTVSSTLSNSSDSYPDPFSPADPRVQRVRRSDSYYGRSTTGFAIPDPRKPKPLKRAPSFSAGSIHAKVNARELQMSPYPSSDEEEKLRGKKAKKAKLKPSLTSSSPSTTDVDSPPPSEVTPKSRKLAPSAKTGSGKGSDRIALTVAAATTKTTPKKPRANLQRNPSILGGELPRLQPMLPPQVPTLTSTCPQLPLPTTPGRRIRRVRATSFAREPARRISFGSLDVPPEDHHQGVVGFGGELGSAFQLH